MSLVLLGFLSIEVVSDAIAVRSWDTAFDGAQPAGYATTATRACSPHRDEVIVMNAGASLVYSARVMDAYTAKTSEAKS